MIYERLRALLRHQISRNVLALYWVQMATFVVPLTHAPLRLAGPGAERIRVGDLLTGILGLPHAFRGLGVHALRPAQSRSSSD